MTFAGFNILFFFAFILSAAVQYNDPDPLAWMTIYIAAAVMCAAQLAKRQPRWLPGLLLAVTLLWIISLLSNIVGEVSWAQIVESISMKTQTVEEAREIGGLSVVLAWALCLLTRQQLKKP
jgi:energy-coupling factor transporter transmembrane protein EcfT